MAEDAFELALEALGRKERTSAELPHWLRERGVEADEVEDGDRAPDRGRALDDARFAARFAEDKRELAGWGAERIREALVARGIESADVEAALAADSSRCSCERAARRCSSGAARRSTTRPSRARRSAPRPARLRRRGRLRGGPRATARAA